MSRLASLLIVLLAIAVATPVLAEDRLNLNGEMRVRGWHVDVDGADSTSTWADQRLRIGGKFSIAEGVSVTFRMDATENSWGEGYANGGRYDIGSGRIPSQNESMQWDRAHLDLQKGMFHLRAGQQYISLGQVAFDAQDNGLLLNIKGTVPVTLFMMVDNDGGSKTDSDAFYYGANVGHKTDVYAANVFAAGQKDNDEEVYLVGVNFAQNFGALNLAAEVDYFTGDANATIDAYGLQGYVDVSTNITETVTLGGQFFYAMGDDNDAQYTFLGNDFGGWDPVFALGTGLDNEAIEARTARPYNILGNGAGLYAGRFYASMKASDALTFAGSVFYGVDDEEDRSAYKDVMALGVGMSYAVMANTKLGAQVQYSEYSKNNATTDDLEKFEVGTGLFVNF